MKTKKVFANLMMVLKLSLNITKKNLEHNRFLKIVTEKGPVLFYFFKDGVIKNKPWTKATIFYVSLKTKNANEPSKYTKLKIQWFLSIP